MMTFKTKHFSDARAIVLVSLLLFSLNACAGSSDRVGPSAGNLQVIELLTPQLETGRLLMAALSERRSQRDFSEKELPLQVLSHLLWAGFGINRPKAGKRTAPSAMNWQEVDIYVALEKGLYLYDAEAHRLVPVSERDVRAQTGRFIQPFVAKAPLNLVYVQDASRIGLAGATTSAEQKLLYSAVTAGCISQNISLYCASAGLGTVVRALIDRPALRKLMGLREDQTIIIAQTVGYPK